MRAGECLPQVKSPLQTVWKDSILSTPGECLGRGGRGHVGKRASVGSFPHEPPLQVDEAAEPLWVPVPC